MTGGADSDEHCPECRKRGKPEEGIFPHYLCLNCRIRFGRCDSEKSHSSDISCGEIVTFRLMDSYSVESQKFADHLRKEILESGKVKDMSLLLDEKRAKLLASENDEVVVHVGGQRRGKILISLRVPSWMTEEGEKMDIGIDNTMCEGAATELVCSNCDAGHYYDIMWDNQGV